MGFCARFIRVYCLRRCSLLLLRKDVQLVQVGLHIAVRDLLAVLQAKNLAHRGIRMNGVTLVRVLQLVLLDIGREGAGHIRRRHLRALGLAQERAELILEGNRRGEDGRALLLRRAVLIRHLDAAAATTRLLDGLRHALLQALERLDGLHRLVTGLLEDGNQLRNLLVDALDLGRLRGGRHARRDRRSGNRCSDNRRSRRLRGLLLLDGRRGGNRRGGNWGII